MAKAISKWPKGSVRSHSSRSGSRWRSRSSAAAAAWRMAGVVRMRAAVSPSSRSMASMPSRYALRSARSRASRCRGVAGAREMCGHVSHALLDHLVHGPLLDRGEGGEHAQTLAGEPQAEGRGLLPGGAGLHGGHCGTGDGTTPATGTLAVRLPADQARGLRLLARRRRLGFGGLLRRRTRFWGLRCRHRRSGHDRVRGRRRRRGCAGRPNAVQDLTEHGHG